MTKKHFIALADTMRATKPEAEDEEYYSIRQWQKDVIALADFCQSQNPNFNRSRWLAYIKGECGPSGGRVK